jgi:hypothetical protein
MSRSCHNAMFSKAACAFDADHPRQAADLLAGDRVALVRHRRTALLRRSERLLRLPHFRPLQVPHFERDLLAQRRDQRQHRDEVRVPVARDHLGGDRRGLQSQLSRRSAPRLPDRYGRTSPRRRKSCPRGSLRRRLNRSRLRRASSYHSASFRPNVIGSACTPWVRPIWTVSLNSNARRSRTPISCSSALRISCEASLSSSA